MMEADLGSELNNGDAHGLARHTQTATVRHSCILVQYSSTVVYSTVLNESQGEGWRVIKRLCNQHCDRRLQVPDRKQGNLKLNVIKLHCISIMVE